MKDLPPMVPRPGPLGPLSLVSFPCHSLNQLNSGYLNLSQLNSAIDFFISKPLAPPMDCCGAPPLSDSLVANSRSAIEGILVFSFSGFQLFLKSFGLLVVRISAFQFFRFSAFVFSFQHFSLSAFQLF